MPSGPERMPAADPVSAAIVPIRILPGTGIDILDQTLLPHTERRLVLGTVVAVAEAIRSLRVRGAPLLGVVGVRGMAIAGEERGVDAPALGQAAAELKRRARPRSTWGP